MSFGSFGVATLSSTTNSVHFPDPSPPSTMRRVSSALNLRQKDGASRTDSVMLSPPKESMLSRRLRKTSRPLDKDADGGSSMSETIKRVLSRKQDPSSSPLLSPSATPRTPPAGLRRQTSYGFLSASTATSPAKPIDTSFEELQEDSTRSFEPLNHFKEKYRTKLHPYSTEEAPYMQAYDRVVLDNDHHAEYLLTRLAPKGSPTFYTFAKNETPSEVLDLGCGQGTWAVEAAMTWRGSGTRVTGFDLVDLWSGVWDVEEEGWPENVGWARGNFVRDKLPFKDESFDLVRMANLALAIPSDRWTFVLSEVRRVLRPGGLLELIDDQRIFSYADAILGTTSRPTRRGSFDDILESESDLDLNSDSDFEEDFVDRPMARPRRQASVSTSGSGSSRSNFDPELDANVENAQNLEHIFETMLLRKYNVHPRPHEMLDSALRNVFSKPCTNRTHNFSLFLPAREYDSAGEGEDGLRRSLSNKESVQHLSALSTFEREGGGGETVRKVKRPSTGGSVRSSTTFSDVPESISSKAAGRLGLTSAGSSSSAPASPGPYQPGGLVVLPGKTFLPMDARELEGHVTRAAQVLVGCKAAVVGWVSGVRDEGGERLVEVGEVEERVWEYECFRRKRFNLPVDPPDLVDFPEGRTSSESTGSHRSGGRFRANSISDAGALSESAGSKIDASNTPRRSDFRTSRGGTQNEGGGGRGKDKDKTLVRTIRVWNAWKPRVAGLQQPSTVRHKTSVMRLHESEKVG